jgi:hypothetical protein
MHQMFHAYPAPQTAHLAVQALVTLVQGGRISIKELALRVAPLIQLLILQQGYLNVIVAGQGAQPASIALIASVAHPLCCLNKLQLLELVSFLVIQIT